LRALGVAPIVPTAGAMIRALHSDEEMQMAWKSPKIVEIALGCEINCYACAEIKT
jgi:coenzyme PQQ precursor peptide PqqA